MLPCAIFIAMKRKYGVTLFEKKCRACGAIKPLSDFHRQGKGWKPRCKPCNVAAVGRWQAMNKDRHNAIVRKWYANNTTKAIAAKRRWKANNKPREKQTRKLWRKAHPQVLRNAHARWRKRHPDLVAESKRRRSKNRRARLRGVLVSLSKEQLAARVAYYGWRCWICRLPYEEMDHVKPLAAGGAHIGSNIRPICGSCNRRKQDKWPFDKRMLLE